MFDPRTDLPQSPKSLDFGHQTHYEEVEAMFKKMIADRDSPENQRRAVDELVNYIEENLLDELADQGCIEGFVLNALEALRRDVKNISSFKPEWRTAACRQVWFKYNH